MRSIRLIAGVSVGLSLALSNAVMAVVYTVDSVGALDPNPNNLTISENAGNNVTLASARTLVAAAHANGTGGVLDFQQQFQGGTFPNAPSSNNGVDFGVGPTNFLSITASSAAGAGGLVATGPQILSLYRLESAGGVNNFDSNTNQGTNVISGGYKSRNPGTGTNPDGTARDGLPTTGTVDFTTIPPTPDPVSGGTTNAGGSYLGITNSSTPATFVFNNKLAYFGITALPRGSSRDSTITLTLSDSTTVALGSNLVTTSAVFFSYMLTPAQLAAGVGITQAQIVNGDLLGPNRYDDLAFILAPTPVTEATYNQPGSGDYNTATNFTPNSVPNGIGATVNFGASITAASTVTISAPVTVGTIRFNNANAYTLASSGANTLTLDATTGNAAIAVTGGNHFVSASTILTDSLDVTTATSTSVTLSGPLTFAANAVVSSLGTGTTRISSPTVTGAAGATVRSNGGTLELASDMGPNVDLRADAGLLRIAASQNVRSVNVTSQATVNNGAANVILKTPTLTIASGGTLDITSNVVLVDYTGSSPLVALTALVKSGRGPTGTFNGTGITSSTAAGSPGKVVGIGEISAIGSPATFRGQTVDNTTVALIYTFAGDTNLDRTVNFTDLLTVAQNFGTTSGGTFTNGDSNFDGAINFSDLLALVQNFSGGLSSSELGSLSADFASDWALAQSLAPEPTSMLALGAAAMAFGRRRRMSV